jgi:tripartite-type tricarboxylate transporter receptor subunit TctC
MRAIRWSVALCIAAGTHVYAADTPDYPARPVRMIVPNAPGSTTDLLGRIIFTRMSDRFGRQIVVDNRPGAGGTLGMETAARSTPDGYTLVAVAASMLTITPHVYSKLAYDPIRDFSPISTYVLAQTALCVHAALPVKSVRDFIELAKAKAASLNMASAGVGSTSHLGGLLLATRAGIEANHVPYKGGGPSIAAVAQGESQWTVPPLSAAIPQVRAGRMRCLATGGDTRSSVTPDLPTLAESGVPGFRFYGWNGVIAPRGTERAIVNTVNRVMGEVLSATDVRKLYFELGEEPAHSTSEAFAKLIREDFDAMGRLVKLAGVKAE